MQLEIQIQLKQKTIPHNFFCHSLFSQSKSNSETHSLARVHIGHRYGCKRKYSEVYAICILSSVPHWDALHILKTRDINNAGDD